jgi:hypothetical protein
LGSPSKRQATAASGIQGREACELANPDTIRWSSRIHVPFTTRYLHDVLKIEAHAGDNVFLHVSPHVLRTNAWTLKKFNVNFMPLKESPKS